MSTIAKTNEIMLPVCVNWGSFKFIIADIKPSRLISMKNLIGIEKNKPPSNFLLIILTL